LREYLIECSMLPTITKRESGHGGNIHWKIHTNSPIDPLNAQELQKNAGYHPAGYGLFDFRCTKMVSGTEITYVSTWKCQNSCD